MILKRTVGPTSEPVTLTEAKAHMRVDISDDDTLISSLIQAAREYIEDATHRALITQTWRLSMDQWPCSDEILLPRPPLASVSSITYTNNANATTTLSSSVYSVDTDSEPGRVKLVYGEDWPSDTLATTSPIKVTYVAGYGAASAVPQQFKQAILMLVAHWYENRETSMAGTIIRDVPFSVAALINLNRAFI
jgi:uncharacterized phiE125 gp8 family phage protein